VAVADFSRRFLSRVRFVSGADVIGCLWGLLVVGVVAVPLGMRLLPQPSVHVSVAPVGAAAAPLDGAESPREQTAAIVVTDAANEALVPALYSTPTSGHCIAPNATPVYIVTESAASTTGADGPYCTDAAACPAGAVIPLGGRAWARLAAGGPVTLSCRFRDSSTGSLGLVPRGAASGGAVTGVCLLDGNADCEMAGQIWGGGGALPAYSFSADTGTGFGSSAPSTASIYTNNVVRWETTTTAHGSSLPVQGPGASAATPAFSFIVDPDTGVYSDDANVLKFSTNSTHRVSITTTNPAIQGTSSTSFQLPTGSPSIANPTYRIIGDASGLFLPGSGELHFSSSGVRKALLYGTAFAFDVPLHSSTSTAAGPSVSFNDDRDTGLWSVSDGVVGFSVNGTNEATLSTSSLSPHAASGLALGTDALPWDRIDVGAGTTADPSVQVGDEDAGLYYDDTTNILYLQSPGSDSINGSVIVAADTNGLVGIVSGGQGWSMSEAVTFQSIISGGAGAGLDVFDPTDVDIRGPTITLGATASPYTLNAIRTPNKTASGSAALFQVPRSVSTTPLANPTCDSTNAGALTYRDDTDDAVVGALCVCNASSGNVYAWRLLDMTTACPL
jgi:hypothetical protein